MMTTVRAIGPIAIYVLAGLAAFAQTSTNSASVNLAINPGAEEMVAVTNSPAVPGKLVPRGWGAYGGGSAFTWGATTNAMHGGQYSAFMTFKDYYVSTNGEKYASSALILGEADGYTGSNAIPVKPRTTYAFSFWLKGDVPSVSIKSVFGWNTAKAVPGDRESLPVTKVRKNGMLMRNTVGTSGILFPSALEWARYSGEFKTFAETKRAAPGISITDVPGLAPGQTIYVDDVEIVEKKESK